MMNQKFLRSAALSLMALLLLPQLSGRQNLQARVLIEVKRFKFTIDPKTPLKDLLPVPPKASGPGGPVLVNDLTKVPEVHFQEPQRVHAARPTFADSNKPTKEELVVGQKFQAEVDKLLERNANQIANINFLNLNKTDRFMELLIANRPDLAGLSFVMGDACRMDAERGKLFQVAVREARRFVNSRIEDSAGGRLEGGPSHGPEDLETYFRDKDNGPRIAAMMQMAAPDRVALRLGLVKNFAAMQEKEAAVALARLALYSDEKEVRSAALKAVEKRTDKEIKDILLKGLTYPWPAVAENAAAAIVQLKRTDLAADLVSILEQPDPRAPAIKEIKGKNVPAVRELVRVNHHRNCLLCHAPGNTKDVNGFVITGGVPTPGESFSPSGYRMQSPDILVRADVTYLRQDFSRLQEVPDAAPWPKMQRFDFLVRTRILSEAEAKAYQAEFAKQKTSPYRQAALTALRALTGRDAEPTAAAWRKVLVMDLQRVD